MRFYFKTFIVMLLLIISSLSIASNQFFGYYKISSQNAVETAIKLQDHTNVILHLAADPETISLQQIDESNVLKTSKLIIEWHGLNQVFYGESGCEYNKCLIYDDQQFKTILDSVIKHIAIPYKGKIAAWYISDEPETNPPSIAALNKAIQEIKKHPEMANIPIFINFDNIESRFSGTPFVLPDGVDWVGITPNYGYFCNPLCETDRYQIILDAVESHNNNSQHKISLMVVGDGWSRNPDHNENELTKTGRNHLTKVNELYDMANQMANERNIPVVGMLAFAYDHCCGGYSIADSTSEIQREWQTLGQQILNTNPPVAGNNVALSSVESIISVPSPVVLSPSKPKPIKKQFSSTRASSVLWNPDYAIDRKY